MYFVVSTHGPFFNNFSILKVTFINDLLFVKDCISIKSHNPVDPITGSY